ncbi:phosphatidate cytidylyltransferase, mitochondrial [Bemisia tabaci]|uniref:phosphatidate cytidylyltransferase, mitochondrial n=1 Tax=Bemisia tabaci TaxID=7038 RepID=UPI003B2829C3
MAARTSKVLLDLPKVYNSVLAKFDKNLIKYGFAYGSAVFKQDGTKIARKPMVDIIFVVDDSLKFHETNLRLNSSHYSFLKSFGPGVISKVQDNWSAKVYFNTLIPLQEYNAFFKYGIISQNNLIDDLANWNELYLAGRLHKPVQELYVSNDKSLSKALAQNLEFAVHAALLLLPDSFTDIDLYSTISNISYNGDFRMLIGEDKRKVQNIVIPQIEKFHDLYFPTLVKLKDFIYMPETNHPRRCSQDTSALASLHHLLNLPIPIQREIAYQWNLILVSTQDTEEALCSLASDPRREKIVQSVFKRIVINSSIKQSLKGILTAGLLKSVHYSGLKLMKMFKSLKKPTNTSS